MRLALTVSLVSFLLVSPLAARSMPHIRRGPTAPRAHTGRPKLAGMEPERATQIQTALIKAGYLTGTPSGQWDLETQASMEKMQAANGWQTKIVPDSRAIIKLGLGPNSGVGAGESSGLGDAASTEAAATAGASRF